MKPVTVAELDPELDAALEALQFVIPLYRRVGRDFLTAQTDPEKYQSLGAIQHRHADLVDAIAAHAARVGVTTETLVRLVESAEPITKKVRGQRKSPAVNALLANVRTAEGYAEKAAEEARVNFAFAKHVARQAVDTLAAYGAGREYLEASLGTS
ncbi:MAG: hypothetical protein PGN16_03920 [Sphingomonas phyllosphaerae]|uniref:hypothetical protein n=1 Tax=Sphingomonas phyllosphaerae TaxID=257003 RepID=UPI002FFB036C